MTQSGDWITDPMEMSIHAVSHFGSMLAPLTISPAFVYTAPAWFADLTGFQLSASVAQQMTIMPTPAEIKALFFKLNPNKAPGPDGLTSGFFKGAWSVIGEETINSVLQFFSSSFLPSSANATILSLVPKFPLRWTLRRHLIPSPGISSSLVFAVLDFLRSSFPGCEPFRYRHELPLSHAEQGCD